MFWALEAPEASSLRAQLSPGIRNASKWPPGAHLGPYSDQAFEMPPNGLLEAIWGQFLTRSLKCLQMASWRPAGTIFWPCLWNASKCPPGGPLGPYSDQGFQMLPHGFLERFWSLFPGRTHKWLQMVSWWQWCKLKMATQRCRFSVQGWENDVRSKW